MDGPGIAAAISRVAAVQWRFSVRGRLWRRAVRNRNETI